MTGRIQADGGASHGMLSLPQYTDKECCIAIDTEA